MAVGKGVGLYVLSAEMRLMVFSVCSGVIISPNSLSIVGRSYKLAYESSSFSEPRYVTFSESMGLCGAGPSSVYSIG